MADLCSELVKSWKIHRSLGSKLQGIHLEMTGDVDENGYRLVYLLKIGEMGRSVNAQTNARLACRSHSVTEIVGGSMERSEEDLPTRYLTFCDPRCSVEQVRINIEPDPARVSITLTATKFTDNRHCLPHSRLSDIGTYWREKRQRNPFAPYFKGLFEEQERGKEMIFIQQDCEHYNEALPVQKGINMSSCRGFDRPPKSSCPQHDQRREQQQTLVRDESALFLSKSRNASLPRRQTMPKTAKMWLMPNRWNREPEATTLRQLRLSRTKRLRLDRSWPLM